MVGDAMLKTGPLDLSDGKISVFVCLSPLGQVFNIAWPAMIKTYNIFYNRMNSESWKKRLNKNKLAKHY